MLARLRREFIAITMLLVGLVLVGVLGMSFVSNALTLRSITSRILDRALEGRGVEVLLGVPREVAADEEAALVSGAGVDRDERLARARHHGVRPGDALPQLAGDGERRHVRHAAHKAHGHVGAQRERGPYSHAISPRSAVTCPTRSSRATTGTPACARKRSGSCMRSSIGTST